MSDLIDRQAALAFPFANGRYDHENADEHFIRGCESYKEYLESLPTVEPERKTGRWIILCDQEDEWFNVSCSECGEDVTNQILIIGDFPDYKPLWNYCYYCGAKMEPDVILPKFRSKIADDKRRRYMDQIKREAHNA